MLQPMHRPLLRHLIRSQIPQNARRTLIAAPKPGSGPLLERRSDRELPSVASQQRNPILRSIPIFLIIIAASAAAIFNYQKSSSSVVQSALYAVRTSPRAQEVLGQEIYFGNKVPWIWGTIDQLHGKVDISFLVKGSREKGMMKFRCERRARMGYFETLEWSLKMPDGTVVDLMEAGGPDPTATAEIKSTMKV